MKNIKIKDGSGRYLFSSNDYEDDNCPVCKLMRRCELEEREPTMKEIEKAMREANNQS